MPFAWSGTLGKTVREASGEEGVWASTVKSCFLRVFQEGVPLSLQLEVLLKSSKPAVGLNNIIFT